MSVKSCCRTDNVACICQMFQMLCDKLVAQCIFSFFFDCATNIGYTIVWSGMHECNECKLIS